MFWKDKRGLILIKVIFKFILIVVLVVMIAAIGYFAYIMLDYSRIDDKLALTPKGTAGASEVFIGTTYTIVTQNLGFGAYTPEFTFFMDGGTESWAASEESVKDCINKGATYVDSLSPDFIFFQEVDTDSTRSYHVDQSKMLAEAFADYTYTEAVNYHSSFLLYPFNQPHGASNSEIMTFSNVEIESGIRRSLPISTGFSKFLDLDRCYSKSYVKVSGEENTYLVLYNVHASAYGNSDTIRSEQMTMLFNDMKAEYEKGNYCVCGGDFNHDFTGTSTQDLNAGGDTVEYGWAQPFPEDLLPDCITRCIKYKDGKLQPTCRNCDVPYEEGNFTIIVDGFLVTSNVTCVNVVNCYNGFEYSDHCPVVMSFTLNAA